MYDIPTFSGCLLKIKGGKMVVSFFITPLKDLVIVFLVEKPYFWIYSVLMFWQLPHFLLIVG